jgi:hypothetical protein
VPSSSQTSCFVYSRPAAMFVSPYHERQTLRTVNVFVKAWLRLLLLARLGDVVGGNDFVGHGVSKEGIRGKEHVWM